MRRTLSASLAPAASLAIAASFPLAASLASLVLPCGAQAQRTVAFDTLSDATPVAVTCGFCATEQFGVVFRELPAPARGLDPSDFPLVLREVQIAMAATSTTGGAGSYVCAGNSAGGTALADIAVWAGVTPPSGSIAALSTIDGWSAGETLVWADVEVPIELSPPTAEGSMMFSLRLNHLGLVGEDAEPITVAAPATYIRVVVTIPAGGSSTLCDAATLEPPAGVPVRDDDGRITAERSFIYAAGVGYLWNEAAGVNGDWAIRLLVDPAAPVAPDGGGVLPDGGPSDGGAGDASAMDAGASDAGIPTSSGGGCSCRATSASGGPGTLALALALTVLVARRRARRSGRGKRALLSMIALVIGCGGATVDRTESAESETDGESAASETTAGEEAASEWLGAIPEGGRLTYVVTRAGHDERRVEMDVQAVQRRGAGIAVRLAPVGTPLDEEPVFPRWVVGGDGVLAGLDETVSLTEPGYSPIDESGRLLTEAADNVAWRVPSDWLTPGRAVGGEEVSAGWLLAERLGDRAEPIPARRCVRLERAEGGSRTALVVCASLGVVESSRSSADGTIEERWVLEAVEGPRTGTDDASAETH